MLEGERRTVSIPAHYHPEAEPIMIEMEEGWDDPYKFYEWEEVDKEMDKMEYVLGNDNQDEFLKLVKSPMLIKPVAVSFLFLYDAVKCATAVLGGQTNGIINSDFGLTDAGWTVLHQSALSGSLKIMTLLLELGFPTNSRGDFPDFNLKNYLPLNVALHKLCYIGSPELLETNIRSAARLLVVLCTKGMLLEAVRLLALNTRDLKNEFFNYVKEGKMFEVGALLLVVGEKLMPLCISEGEDYIVFNNFKEIGHFLQAKNTWSAMSNAELTEKKGILSLLDIFAKIGNQLNAYARLKKKRNPLYAVSDVVTLLEDSGFDVECKDLHIDDYTYRIGQSSFMRKTLQICGQPEHDWCRKQNLTSNLMNQKRHGRLPFCSQPRQPLIPTRHLLHTSSFQNTDSKYASLTPTKKSVNVVQNFNSCKRWVSFMAIFRRGVRRV